MSKKTPKARQGKLNTNRFYTSNTSHVSSMISTPIRRFTSVVSPLSSSSSSHEIIPEYRPGLRLNDITPVNQLFEDFNFDDSDSSNDEVESSDHLVENRTSQISTPSNLHVELGDHHILDPANRNMHGYGLQQSGVEDIISMLQQQQSALQTVIDKQTSLEENQSQLEQTLKGPRSEV